MAVHKRSYRAYTGALTPAWSRLLVLYRYSREGMFRSKATTGFFFLCFFYPLLCLLAIYVSNSVGFLSQYRGALSWLQINNNFFFYFVDVQGVLAFIFTSFAGPGLISSDLANGALPLYFCRPFSRTEYILGKASVLAILLSYITWVPGLVLFAVQCGLAGFAWTRANLWMAGSIVLSCSIWIAILCLLSLALSAWVRWKIVAGALLLGVLFLGSGFGHAINGILQTNYGYVLDLANLIGAVWAKLFGIRNELPISQTEAWVSLLTICALCLLLLWRKVRAYEVVK